MFFVHRAKRNKNVSSVQYVRLRPVPACVREPVNPRTSDFAPFPLVNPRNVKRATNKKECIMAASVELDGMIFNNENAMGDERHESSQKQPVHERNLDATLQEDDLALDKNLRPQHLSEYLGQEKIKESLAILVEAAKKRGETPDHILFSGPPGLGKTTLAGVVANELSSRIKTTSGPAIERTGDLAALLTNLEEGDVLFIDEIHRLNKMVEEVLYPALEDFVLDIIVGKGPAARSIRLELPHFTLIGATTRAGLLTGPLRDRFGVAFRLQYYTPRELAEIVQRSASILGIRIQDEGALEIARRSRGTPRLANRVLKRVRDWAQVQGIDCIDEDVAAQALSFFEIDHLGLDTMDNRILELLVKSFFGKPVGLSTIASALSEDPSTIEDVYEPFLIQQGLIARTPKGRQATRRAYEHLGVPFEDGTA